jgi:Flp pilus assembly protein TadG
MKPFVLSYLRLLATRFAEDRRASILPIFAIMVIIMVVIAGAAFDVSRTVNAREKLSYALDAAALDVAVDLSSTLMTAEQIKTAVANSMRANLSGEEFLEKAIQNIEVTVDSENGLVTVTSSATLDNYFIDLGGYMVDSLGPESFSFGTSAQATYSRYDVELALVLDVTGSMRSHIGSLKDAATSALDILIPEGTKEKDSKVKISVIPYSEGVNLGEYANKVAKGAQGTQNCATERLGDAQFTDDPYDYDKKDDDSYFGGGSSGCAPTPQMEPLTAKRQKIETAIGKLSASGSTAGQTGIAWGWYTLSPNWANLWPSSSEPAAYDNEEVLKFAIVMTDGDFNRYYRKRSLDKDDCQTAKKWGYVTETCKNGTHEYWYPYGSGGYSGTSSKRAMELCEAMKDEGIKIYTIFFGSYKSDPVRVMQSCASDGGYYQASSKEELVQAFANIAKKIQAIYLSM